MQNESNNPNLFVLSTIPRSGTWFLRYAISFMCHLAKGGWVRDRITNEIIGNPQGPDFEFKTFKGGPLFNTANVFGTKYIFVGHTVCPGFLRIAKHEDWWCETDFHVPGYDYFGLGLDYKYTPVALGTEIHTPVDVDALEQLPWLDARMRIALVYRNPLDYAASYYHYGMGHSSPVYSTMHGRPLAEIPFADYLFESALPSYAKQFYSYQVMAKHRPHVVRLFKYQDLVRVSDSKLPTLLSHLGLALSIDSQLISTSARLARSEHLKRIEQELGHSLDGFQATGGTHIRNGRHWSHLFDASMQARTVAYLRSLGIDTDLMAWPLVD